MASVERKRKADNERTGKPLDQKWKDEKEGAARRAAGRNRDIRGPQGDERGQANGPYPPRGRRRELPPVRPPRGRVRPGDRDTRSLVEMRRSSPVDVDHHRTSLTATQNAITCFFHKDDDYTSKPVKLIIHPKKYRKLETVTRDLSDNMKELPFGVRSIYTPRAKHRVHNLEDFTNDGHYVCSSNRKFARGIDIGRLQPQHVWHNLRPDSGRRVLNKLLHDVDLRSGKRKPGSRPGYDLTNVYTRNPPKKLTVMKNGEPDVKHTVLLNRRTAQTFEQVMKTLSELFFFAVRKLYTIQGQVINSLSTMLNGPEYLVAAGLEQFINMSMDYANPNPSRAQTRMRSQQFGSRLSIQSRLQSRKERLARTKGRWKVSVRTNTLPSAGTQAQITITVYGHKGNSGAITLGQGDGHTFQPGNIDEFDIQVGNVGEVYKIRLAHDNSGDFPGWLCDEVSMHDMDTGENLNFSCHRWLARDEDDQEITRELAVKRPGESILPLIKYQVDVYTGDIWGGGTDANVYITIYGDRGDTGVRQLYAETKGVYFKQGQMDSFEVEAVSLGHLKRIIVGHDGTGPGAGWFLDKVVIREPPLGPDHDFNFYCGKWLDEGEDDGKIVRELRVQDEYMDDILEKRNWEWEKWKYEKDCKVMFYSVITGKPLRLNKDLTVDGLGEEKDRMGMFNVIPKKPMKPVFSSVANPHSHLAIDNGRVTGMGKGGPYCEFRVRVQADRTTLLESVKNPLQFITIGPDGSPGEVRGILDKEPTRRFYVYAKGCFRHKGIIMLCTSTMQCINVDRLDKSLTGKGRRGGPQSQFKVHKVSPGGIRMFESISSPGNYIRLKDGKIDCGGLRDKDSHFLVLRHKDKGYITLQSASQRGLYIGMTSDGRVHTTIDTGVRNIWLYPEVVEWGIPKSKSVEMIEEETLQDQRETPVSVPPIPPSPRGEKQFAANEPGPDEIVEEGDWGIKVTTIEQLVNADVSLVCYGDLGNSGPIILGAPPGKLIFQDGNEDEFRANLLKIGKLYKIRVELLSKTSTKEPSWKVKDIKLQDLNTKETLKFVFNRWLSTTEDDQDIMRELPAVRPGEDILPVFRYVVSVYTGKEMGADTEADIYLNVFGERGDWGKRYLRQSNNKTKYRTGQKDVFYIEAVSLGHLQRCIVGHDATGTGEGWYLEQITVRESENASEEYVFPCNRWLDTGMLDRKIERTLMVKEPSPTKAVSRVDNLTKLEDEEELPGMPTPGPDSVTPAPGPGSPAPVEPVQEAEDETKKLDVKSTGDYDVWMTTNEDSKPPNGGRVFIVLYGSKKKSEEIKLYSQDANSKTFEPGNIDKFQISVGDLGDLYKIRVGRDDSEQWTGWHLGEVKLTDSSSKEEIIFNFNRWLSRELDDGDMVRELPVTSPGKQPLNIYHYQVQVYTGDHWAAGTDANMYITINGTRGDSGKRLLYKCLNNRVKFQRGQVDTFEFEAVDLGDLDSVIVNHDGRGHGAGIFLDKIVVKERDSENSELQFVFPCGRWLDSHQDDCLTQRTLRMLDMIDSAAPAPHKDGNRISSGNYEVTIRTSPGDNTATTAHTFITLYGTTGQSAVPLRQQGQDTHLFTPGIESKFQISGSNVGKLTKIRLEHDNTGSTPDWKVDYVKLLDMDTSEELVFYLDRWLSVNQDDHEICRELPVVRKGIAPLPVHKYVVAITTGSLKDSGTEHGQVSVCLIGVNGDTGMRRLTAPITKHRSPWQPSQEDIFIVEAVSVGKLKNVEVNFSSPKSDDQWYLQQIRVTEDTRAVSQSVLYCHQWMTDNQVFPVSEIQPATDLLNAIDSIPRGLERPVKTKGRWMVWVQTGTQNDSGTSDKVCLVLCGLKGESEPVHVNDKDSLNPGSFIRFEAKVSDIGLLFKVRVYFEEKHLGSSWFLSKMKLKDQDTGEELHFDHNDWIESTNENPEGAVELPVVRPDLHPVTEQIYIVSVKTGELPRSETDADVFCTLIGQWGTTGVRSLADSGNKMQFREGQVDQFTLTCMDLGKVTKVNIGHDLAGRGQGWYCESVTIKVAEEDETVFPCHRWLDTGCDDRQLLRELLPFSRYPINDEPPTNYLRMSDGIWNFHIKTAGNASLPLPSKSGPKSGEVSIVVYGSKATKGPIELSGRDRQVLLRGKVDQYEDYELGDIGEIEKIRVSSGYEGDTQAIWTIQEVVLEDQKSGDLLKFDFSAWVGEVGGDIRKELPYIAPGKDYRPVVKYYIEVHTSEAEMTAGTNANVFITLYGSQSDSGRRHLIHSREARKRFQPGQVDKFELEAVHLGDLEKLVVAKGSGTPWLLEKIVVKEGEFAAEEQAFLFEGWIGDKQSQDVEIEETLKLTATIPSHVAINILDAPDLDISKGHWTIEALTGGRRGPEEAFDAVVVFSGMKGESQPLPLKSTRDNPFQIGQTDMFTVKYSEDVGELRKIRLGFQDTSVDKGWYIRKIQFEDVDTKDTFWTDLNGWVAVDNKLDGWKEFPIPWPAIIVPKVCTYQITVTVGEVNPDWSDSDHVYIYMYGEQGQTGRRLLKHSLTNTAKIKQNQTDKFELEAVDLGDLMKIVIGHDRQGQGEGWFLVRVVVQESADGEELRFECNSWLDAGEDDGQTERTLYPAEGPIPEDQNQNAEVIVPLISPKPSPEPTPREEEEAEAVAKSPSPEPQPEGHKYVVTASTGSESGEGTGSTVVLVLYGDKGQSQPLLIGEQDDYQFASGATDNFTLTVPDDLGELFKVRIGFHGDEKSWYEDQNQAPSWFVEQFSIEDPINSVMYEFDAGVWVKMDAFNDFWRELPVKKLADQLPVYEYKVTIFTSEDSKSGTDSNVFIQIFGECGDTGYRKLMSSKTNTNKLEQGNQDIFEIRAVDLGKLSKVKIRHDGSGPSSGWKLDKVVVQETETTTIRYVFKYERWLDESDGETGIEQELILSDILVADEEVKQEELLGNSWQIVSLTGEDQAEGTDCAAELILYGDKGQSQPLIIGDKDDFSFNRGATDTFNIRILEDIGTLYKVRVGFHDDGKTDWFNNLSQAPTWFIEQLNLVDETSAEQYELGPAWVRVTSNEDYWREIPVTNKGDPLPVHQYLVELYTGSESKPGTDANVSLQIFGQRGDTGLRKLMASKTNENKFEQGKCDVFELNAVDLDDLVKVKVTHYGSGPATGWYLDKIVVKATSDADTRYVFNCDKWQNEGVEGRMVEQEFILSDVLHGKVEEEDTVTGNPWTVWTVTGSEVEASLDNPVDLILYGDKGHSQLVVIGGAENFIFTQGQVDEFQIIVPEDIGELYKVRVGFHGDRGEVPWYQNYSLAPSWFLDSLKLKDETSATVYEMKAGIPVKVEKYSDFWRELPVTNTDQELPVYQYQVELHTVEEFDSGSDATVTVQIFGERGDTGERRLMESKTNTQKFQAGAKDMFEMPAVDLGKLLKVKVTHDGAGVGSGWLLDKVVVKETEDAKQQYVFSRDQTPLTIPAGSLVAEETIPLSVVEEVPAITERTPSPPGKAGEWKVLVTTSEDADSGTDSNVTLTVYGDADNSGPLTLGSVSTGFFYAGHTDEFDVFFDTEEIGQIRKIRLEHDNSGKPWKVDKLVLKNKQDKSEIEFPINRKLCLDSNGMDIAVEIPVKGQDWPVRNYVVQTVTGDGFSNGTDTMVYINLIGTLGDSGKRFLVHNMEETDRKFQSGQTDTFIVEAVDLGRLDQVCVGHDGKGPGSGWFLQQVTVRESMEAEEEYVFKCDRWLHDEKDDGLTERMLSVEMVRKSKEPDDQMGTQEQQEEFQDQEDPELPKPDNNEQSDEKDTENVTEDKTGETVDELGETNEQPDAEVDDTEKLESPKESETKEPEETENLETQEEPETDQDSQKEEIEKSETPKDEIEKPDSPKEETDNGNIENYTEQKQDAEDAEEGKDGETDENEQKESENEQKDSENELKDSENEQRLDSGEADDTKTPEDGKDELADDQLEIEQESGADKQLDDSGRHDTEP